MTDKSHIQSSLKEAGVYQKQGLLSESREKYQEILEVVKADKALSEDEQLIALVCDKIGEIDTALVEIENEPDTPELSGEVQDLISELFSFSKNEDTAAVESAMALATFGQYEKALGAFQILLDRGILPLDVAKNMLQCHLSLGTHEAAISQYKDWISHRTFPGEELNRIGEFLEHILERDGIKADLPRVESPSLCEKMTSKATQDISEEDVTEILSIKIIFDCSHMQNQIRDFDVKFQLGNSVTIDIENSEKDVLSLLEHGARISKIQCYSSFYFFNAKGIISGRNLVTAGPKQGDYSVVLSLASP